MADNAFWTHWERIDIKNVFQYIEGKVFKWNCSLAVMSIINCTRVCFLRNLVALSIPNKCCFHYQIKVNGIYVFIVCYFDCIMLCHIPKC